MWRDGKKREIPVWKNDHFLFPFFPVTRKNSLSHSRFPVSRHPFPVPVFTFPLSLPCLIEIDSVVFELILLGDLTFLTTSMFNISVRTYAVFCNYLAEEFKKIKNLKKKQFLKNCQTAVITWNARDYR